MHDNCILGYHCVAWDHGSGVLYQHRGHPYGQYFIQPAHRRKSDLVMPMMLKFAQDSAWRTPITYIFGIQSETLILILIHPGVPELTNRGALEWLGISESVKDRLEQSLL